MRFLDFWEVFGTSWTMAKNFPKIQEPPLYGGLGIVLIEFRFCRLLDILADAKNSPKTPDCEILLPKSRSEVTSDPVFSGFEPQNR